MDQHDCAMARMQHMIGELERRLELVELAIVTPCCPVCGAHAVVNSDSCWRCDHCGSKGRVVARLDVGGD